MYTLDTNAIIYYLKDDLKVVPALKNIFLENDPLYISVITEIELFGFSKLSDKESLLIEELLSTLAIIPVDSHLARTAGDIRRLYRLNIADSTIAATALFTNTTLVTRNIKDFQKISNLSIKPI